MNVGEILRSRYKILEVLGSGAFGIRYLAEDIDVPYNPKCVIKQFKSNANPGVLNIAKRLFESEAQVLYRLGNESDRIPKLFSRFEDKGQFYLVQEFVDGEDLTKEVLPGKKSSEAEVIQLLEEILEVFTVTHNRNIIHRDIKPANLIRRKKDGKIVVIDFGAVKEVSILMMNTEGQIFPSVAIGTPGFMPREQASGQPKLCSDIYAIGMLGIYALTGVEPHDLPKDPTNGEIIWQNWANVSDQMADVLSKMVRYNFRERYQSAFDTMDAIIALKPKLKPKSQSQSLINSKQRREVLKILGGLGAGVGLTILLGRIFGIDSNSSQTLNVITNPDTSTPTSLIKTTTPQTSLIKNTTQSNRPLQTFKFETVTVNAKGKITNRRNLNANYFIEDLGNGVTLYMVKIPAGTFTMGSPRNENLRDDDESPQHQVSVPGFFMGRYQVTQAQYEAIMGSNPAKFKGINRPVEQVSWDDAVVFCKKLSQKTARTYRLPSEAEWEYACRAGSTTSFYFKETITTDLVNYDGNYTYADAPKGVYRGKTTEVGKFPPNAFGLYDMHGNVNEWCEDTWHSNYKGAPNDGSAWVDNDNQSSKLLRGGSWTHLPRNCRSADRHTKSRDVRNYDIGFRVVMVFA
ncbi:MAG: bifunctional serine/threonine-protein kinase/formylglycine-generating enzyme family protein [Cyanobacteria bacterium P01_D01_bin.50]